MSEPLVPNVSAVLSSFARVMRLARPEWTLLSAGTFATLAGTGVALIYPTLISGLMDRINGGGKLHIDNPFAVGMVALVIVHVGMTLLQRWLFAVCGERFVARLRERVYSAILGQETAFFDTSKTGELQSRLLSDTAVLQRIATVNLANVVQQTVLAFGAMALLVWTSPLLAAIGFTAIPVVLVSAAVFGRSVRGLARDRQRSLANSAAVAGETLTGIRTVRWFARESYEVTRYGEAVQECAAIGTRWALVGAVFQSASTFAIYATTGAVIVGGGALVANGQLTAGALVAALLYTSMTAVAWWGLAGLWGDFMQADGASERVFELLASSAPIEQGGGETVTNLRGHVVFDQVGFHYPSRPDKMALHEVSLALSPGEMVAVVGPSGAGKSTIAALLCRFYDPDLGVIRIDGHNLSSLDPHWWRSQIGVVSQEPTLLGATIGENIRYGMRHASDADVRSAARDANAVEFIEALPDGYQTEIGERGVQLSAGQRQRIAIARAILLEPTLLILDEATSALDGENEHLVQGAIARLTQTRTTLVIAHRLSTIMAADRIVVLVAGKILERGTHAELLARGGVYSQLIQNSGSRDGALVAK